MTRALPPLLLLLGLSLAAPGCGPEAPAIVGSQGTLELVEPAAPIGLHYGERALLRVRYRYRGEPRQGARLSVEPVGPLGGSSLSAAQLLTDARGEAALALQAGAAETAFRVEVGGPDAQALEIDVAVSRRAFGAITLRLDRRGLGRAAEVRALRASLLTGATCAGLAPTPLPPAALRSQRVELKAEDDAPLTFSTLLLRSYTAVGRAEDGAGRLLGWGCLELPEAALAAAPEDMTTPAGPIPEAPLPLSDVYARPAGTYQLTAQLALDPLGALWSPWGSLACGLGAGQALLDAILAALPPREMPLGSRLQARRGPAGADRCRPARRGTDDSADLLLDNLLAAPGLPGAALRAVAQEVRALQRGLTLRSQLRARGVAARVDDGGQGAVVADHALIAAELDSGAATVRYDLAALGLPVLEARDLLLPRTRDRLDLPTHGFTLGLPALWRRALQEAVLGPRGVASVDKLLQGSLAAARSGGKAGCAAVDALLCDAAGPPCAGVLQQACEAGAAALAADLGAALRDGPAGLDLSLAGFLLVADPEGTLIAQALEAGQAQARLQLGVGPASASGALSGLRQ